MKLGLKELEFVRIEEETEEMILIEVKPVGDENVSNCPSCNSTNLKKQGSARMRRFKDLPIRDKYVKIGWNRQNYKCKDCLIIFTKDVSDIHNKNMTTRMKERTMELIKISQTYDISNYEIAEAVGLNEKSIRRFKKELEAEL